MIKCQMEILRLFQQFSQLDDTSYFRGSSYKLLIELDLKTSRQKTNWRYPSIIVCAKWHVFLEEKYKSF